MIIDDQLFHLLYVSRVAPGTGGEQIAAIATISRQRNLAVLISGALLCDGSRFCQLLEGPEVEVRLLMTRITADPRHHDISVRASGHFGLPRLTARWRLGMCSAAEMSHLVRPPIATDEVALALFMSGLAASLDS